MQLANGRGRPWALRMTGRTDACTATSELLRGRSCACLSGVLALIQVGGTNSTGCAVCAACTAS